MEKAKAREEVASIEAEGLVKQILLVSQAFSENPNAAHKKQAAALLVEWKKLEQAPGGITDPTVSVRHAVLYQRHYPEQSLMQTSTPGQSTAEAAVVERTGVNKGSSDM